MPANTSALMHYSTCSRALVVPEEATETGSNNYSSNKDSTGSKALALEDGGVAGSIEV